MASNIEHISTEIRQRRLNLNYTQMELADLSGVAERTIRSFENGQNISLQNLVKILDVLGLEIKMQYRSIGDEAGKSI